MTILFTAAEALNGLVQRSGSSDVPRTAWVFSSRLRRVTSINPDLRAPTGVEEAQVSKLVAAFPPVVQAMTSIPMALNPNSVTFSEPKRISTKMDTQTGSIFTHWVDKQGQNNDVLTLSLKGSTGNIDMRGAINAATGTPTSGYARLLAWHNLYLLTREPILCADNVPNTAYIEMQTKLMPFPITFEGFFNQVLDFEQSANDPNRVQYSCSFTVLRTNPDLNLLINEITTLVHP